MAYYLQATNEENLYTCYLEGLWGSKTTKISNWKPGDSIIAYVDRELAALFTIISEPFYDESNVWPNELYPHRVQLRPEKIIHPEHRYSISSPDTREVLFKHHTRSYGVSIVLSARPLDEEPAHVLLQYIESAPHWEDFDAEQLLGELQERQSVQQSVLDEEIVKARPVVHEQETEISPHSQMQYYLADLGRSLRYQVWIPKADQGREYDGQILGDLSLFDLPPLPFSEDVVRIIRNIDVIWFMDDHPTHLFEVEHTTSVYSGLLRMSDFVTLIPSLNIYMFICSDIERRDKVRAEVNRPTFSRRPIPLAERCRFIPFEQLADFMQTQREYLQHFSTSILEEISEPLVRQ
jgi:predicted RNA-binding protein